MREVKIEGTPQARVWHNPMDGKFYQAQDEGIYQAQMIDTTHIDSIKAQVVLEEVLGTARPDYRLDQICRPVSMKQLVGSIDVATKLTGQEKVPPLVAAKLSAQSYSRLNFALWKNVVHVVIATEAQMMAVHDLMKLHTTDAAGELARMRNKQIAEIAETATATAGADWGARTAGKSDNNPFDNILPRLNAIRTAGYQPDVLAVHDDVWADFIQNDYVKELVKAGLAQVQGQQPQFSLPGYPTVKAVVDSQLTNTVAIVGSTKAPGIVLGEGPSEAAKYRDEDIGADLFVIRQWLQPQIAVSAAIAKLTGVHA